MISTLSSRLAPVVVIRWHCDENFDIMTALAFHCKVRCLLLFQVTDRHLNPPLCHQRRMNRTKMDMRIQMIPNPRTASRRTRSWSPCWRMTMPPRTSLLMTARCSVVWVRAGLAGCSLWLPSSASPWPCPCGPCSAPSTSPTIPQSSRR